MPVALARVLPVEQLLPQHMPLTRRKMTKRLIQRQRMLRRMHLRLIRQRLMLLLLTRRRMPRPLMLLLLTHQRTHLLLTRPRLAKLLPLRRQTEIALAAVWQPVRSPRELSDGH